MIDIISLAWNKYEMTERFLDCLKKHTDFPHRLIFTDNGSEEPISDLVKKYYPDVDLIRKEKNIGCPATRNEQMEHANTDIVFWLDNDTIVGPNWYKPILDRLEDDSVGITGPTGMIARSPFVPKSPFEYTAQEDCDFIVGYLVGFKRKYYKPINDYHLACNIDDVELSLGVKLNGKRCVKSPPCFAQHLTSKTPRGWEPPDYIVKNVEFWNNWVDKGVFERFK